MNIFLSFQFGTANRATFDRNPKQAPSSKVPLNLDITNLYQERSPRYDERFSFAPVIKNSKICKNELRYNETSL